MSLVRAHAGQAIGGEVADADLDLSAAIGVVVSGGGGWWGCLG